VAYEVERTDEFTLWWDSLNDGEQIAIAKVVGALEEIGPDLRRPYVGAIRESKIPNLKELVVQYAGNPYRVFFVFDPRRVAILLLGGMKTGGNKGQKAWYKMKITQAEKIYAQYLKELKREGLI
jgi:hypothetical protein